MPPKHHPGDRRADATIDVNPLYSSPGMDNVPKNRLPAGSMSADIAYQIVHDELLLDGNARTNLATFVTTWMEPQGKRLMAECADKNMIDKDEYPRTADLEQRCVRMLADLWHASPEDSIGCSALGSSEACMLGGLALKRRWQKRTGGEGKPNLVMGANVQVVWEKFCEYWDVEARLVPVVEGRHHLDGPSAVEHCDENTIGVVAILGSTYDGAYEPVAEIAAALDEFQERTGNDVPIHVDGASGAFVAPFIDPGLLWDFRVDRVASINASGHKYGLVYPGVGWVIWRDRDALPKELIFDVDYLGGHMPTFTLNFSRPGSQIAAQYYNLIRLGFDGYRAVQQESRDVAKLTARAIGELEPFELLSDGSELPVFAFKLRDDIDAYTVFDVSDQLRASGWIVPAYKFPKNLEHVQLLRVVVRNGFSQDLAELFLADVRAIIPKLERQSQPLAVEDATSFHH
ncbi:MAG: glutamate decarboxylase [Thermoleophilaceae bacterium]|nr:glutamate decarboxylase [Thermoleophilaceae bacterium]